MGGVLAGDVAVVADTDGTLTEGWLMEGTVVVAGTVVRGTVDVVGADEWRLEPQPARIRAKVAMAAGNIRPDFSVMR